MFILYFYDPLNIFNMITSSTTLTETICPCQEYLFLQGIPAFHVCAWKGCCLPWEVSCKCFAFTRQHRPNVLCWCLMVLGGWLYAQICGLGLTRRQCCPGPHCAMAYCLVCTSQELQSCGFPLDMVMPGLIGCNPIQIFLKAPLNTKGLISEYTCWGLSRKALKFRTKQIAHKKLDFWNISFQTHTMKFDTVVNFKTSTSFKDSWR